MATPSDNIQNFLEFVQADTLLLDKLLDSDMNQFLEVAKESGFQFTEVDFIKYQAKASLELSDDQLSEVLGGRLIADREKRVTAGAISGSVAAGWSITTTAFLIIIK